MKANPTNGLSRLAHIMFTPDGIKDLEHYLDTYAIRPKEKKSFQDNFITSYIAFFIAGQHKNATHNHSVFRMHTMQHKFCQEGLTETAERVCTIEMHMHADLHHNTVFHRHTTHTVILHKPHYLSNG